MEIGYHRTQEFAIEYKAGNEWKPLHRGTTIAGRRAYDFPTVNARVVRLNILKANEVPSIEEFHVYAPGAKLPESIEKAMQAEQQRQARLKWFDQAKYGLFINWGLYSIPAGEWKGKPIGGIGEWIMHNAKIPVKEYELLAKQFNPTKFNADEWAQLAVDAGMKYLVFDCKHHDGFALYRSAVSAYNCYDATPWKRDPFKELQEACAKRGITFCFYYSQATDWHEPNGANNTWDFAPNDKKDFDQYLRDKSIPQIKELLTNYGPIGLIWFDVPTLMKPERCQQLVDVVRSLQPATLINSRLGPGGLQDYQSRGDNEIPHSVTPGAWETAATINDTWGFKKDDHNWKTPEDICFKLVDIVSKGGNYLLNVGPDGDGAIPKPSQDNLRIVGAWLKINGEAIYGAGRTPFGDELGSTDPDPEKKDRKGRVIFNAKTDWRCTTQPGKLYFHLFKWPGATFETPAVAGKVKTAYLLSDRKPLPVKQEGGRVSVTLPENAPKSLANVLCLDIHEK
jgi:alpha-L-fucosidase